METAENSATTKNLPVSRLKVAIINGTPLMRKCQHCVTAPCVEACVSGSMQYAKDGNGVIQNLEVCVGCGTCMIACPFEAVTFDEIDERGLKCNLCKDCEIPPCVKACQSGALVYKNVNNYAQQSQQNHLNRIITNPQSF